MLGGRRLMSNYIVVNCELTSWRTGPHHLKASSRRTLMFMTLTWWNRDFHYRTDMLDLQPL